MAHCWVKRAKWLIQQQQAWLGSQRSGKRDSLPLPAGQLGRPPVAHAGQLYELQQLPHPAAYPLQSKVHRPSTCAAWSSFSCLYSRSSTVLLAA